MTVRDDAKRHYAPFYLTLVSIIQSFALGFLLSAVGSVHAQAPARLWVMSAPTAVLWLEVVATFQAVVLYWHINTTNAMMLRQLVGLSDSYIPFAFAIPQFVMISAIQQDAALWVWFLAMAGYSAVALWGYVMLYLKNAREPENQDVLERIGNHRVFTIVYTLVAVPVFAGLACIFSTHESPAGSVVAMSATNLIFIVFTVAHGRMWNRLTAV